MTQHTDFTARFRTGYMDPAVFNLQETIDKAVEVLEPVKDEFDTLVGTGFSGGLVIPMLAMRLGKTFVLIRKEGDDSHQGSGTLLGELGARWIFVDDFVSTGRTRKRVISKIEEACEDRGFDECEMVGNYYYSPHVKNPYTRVEGDPYEDRTKISKQLERIRAEDTYLEQLRQMREERSLVETSVKYEEPFVRKVKKPSSGPDILMEMKTVRGVLTSEEVRMMNAQMAVYREAFVKPAPPKVTLEELLDIRKKAEPSFTKFTQSDFRKRS